MRAGESECQADRSALVDLKGVEGGAELVEGALVDLGHVGDAKEFEEAERGHRVEENDEVDLGRVG